MIYLTGDIHGEMDIEKLSYRNWDESRSLTKNDYLIIMGDFGFPFFNSDVDENNKPLDSTYNYWIKWLSEKPYTILWIDGNHENFNYWEKQPVTEWHGGKVQIHPHAPNVIHLMRGEIYEIDGMTFFAFGGAMSHDKEYRKPDVTWWEQEEATETEILNARRNLEKYNKKVDFILTHTMPEKISRQLFNSETPDKTAHFLDEIISDVKYNMWFCGHYHRTAYIRTINMLILFNKVLSLEQCMDLQKEK